MYFMVDDSLIKRTFDTPEELNNRSCPKLCETGETPERDYLKRVGTISNEYPYTRLSKYNKNFFEP